jgi:hypothetical protein
MSASPDMSSTLFEVYDTKQAASHTSEDAARQAETELFLGLCKSAGIDPKYLTDEQVSALWKAAADGGKPEEKKDEKPEGKKDEKDEKKEAAIREWQEKRAAAEKVAEADALGRVMAHAFVDETKKIAEATKAAELPPQFMQNMKGKSDKGEEKPKDEKDEGKKSDKDEDDKKKESQDRAAALIAKLASQAGASSTPNLDEVAAYHAIDMLKAAGVDEKLAHARINAVFTLGLPESTKIASEQTHEQAMAVRGLEFCEAAGFPVDWTKV